MQVIEAVFSFLKLHQQQGAQQRIWEELQTIQQVKFNTMKLGSSIFDTTFLACIMNFFEDKNIVTGDTLFFKYNSKNIEKWLQLLTPSRAN